LRLTGHKTRSVVERYTIVSDGDLRPAAQQLAGLTGTRQGQSALAAIRAVRKLLRSWRRRPESNRRIEVLQTSALPLGYAAFSRSLYGSFVQRFNTLARHNLCRSADLTRRRGPVYLEDCWPGGNSSVVECDLAKVEVAGSNPVSRSIP
jgi:hypothetical protein